MEGRQTSCLLVRPLGRGCSLAILEGTAAAAAAAATYLTELMLQPSVDLTDTTYILPYHQCGMMGHAAVGCDCEPIHSVQYPKCESINRGPDSQALRPPRNNIALLSRSAVVNCAAVGKHKRSFFCTALSNFIHPSIHLSMANLIIDFPHLQGRKGERNR